MAEFIYKIVSCTEWEAAQSIGFFLGSVVDLQDGYIHFSTATQAPETAARHFAGQAGLLLVAVDPLALGEELKWEPSRGGQLFPHLYSPLPCEIVVRVVELPLGSNGQHIFPLGIS